MAKGKKAQSNGSNGDSAPTKLNSSELEQVGHAIPILRDTLKSAIRIHGGLDLPNREIERRSQHADTLETLVADANGSGAFMPPELRQTAVVALRLLRGRIDKAGSDYAKYTSDREAVDEQLIKLDRLGKRLGAQLVLDPASGEKAKETVKQAELEVEE